MLSIVSNTLFPMTIIADLGCVAIGARTTWVVGSGVGSTEGRRASAGEGKHWTYILEHHEIVRTRVDLQRFVGGGGHALIEGALIAAWWPEFLNPIKCTRYYSPMPFISIENPPPFAKARFARGVLRQTVFSRDEDRCRVCGRSVNDSPDLTLQVHHVLPHAKGGMTVEHNLIVLCNTCHDGMEEFDDIRQAELHDKIAVAFFTQHRMRHAQAVASYRRLVKRLPNTQPFPPAVLPLVWNPQYDRYSPELISGMIHDNLAIRWLPVTQWIKIAKQAWN